MFGQLLDIIFLKTFNSEFSDIEMWFTDEITYITDITLVIN